ncbi:hypothetical protein [Methanothermobacter tenebrarum]|uniref:Uncharacterized protein n=1 Tax=Methanothermobacter tenebrarum TaxID=680118 RepID=A0A328P856_9EURY|nr:hypothetical protein [Methanothermobacter tenebrarum]NPV64451.1 hypothetical protein [Methanobacteriaceae archaeon]RAO78487.1 hypothetical protein DPC56_07865 [Methanothermobacter tenebrarum]
MNLHRGRKISLLWKEVRELIRADSMKRGNDGGIVREFIGGCYFSYFLILLMDGSGRKFFA